MEKPKGNRTGLVQLEPTRENAIGIIASSQVGLATVIAGKLVGAVKS